MGMLGNAARAVAIVLAVLAVPALSAYALIDVTAPADRIVNRGRVWKCQLLGGTTTIELGLDAGLADGLYLSKFGSVHDLVVADVMGPDGRRLGRGAWTRSESAAVDGFARRVSSRHSRLTAKGLGAELRAARECAERGIF